MVLTQTTEIRRATVDELFTNGRELFVEHWKEIASDKRLTEMSLNLDEDKYRAMEEQGSIFCLAAYDGEELVGYSVTFLGTHLLDKNFLFAQNDHLFVTKRKRKSRIGLDLIAAIENLAGEQGAKALFIQSKPGTTLDLLLPRLGYEVVEKLHSKEL